VGQQAMKNYECCEDGQDRHVDTLFPGRIDFRTLRYRGIASYGQPLFHAAWDLSLGSGKVHAKESQSPLATASCARGLEASGASFSPSRSGAIAVPLLYFIGLAGPELHKGASDGHH
jgi:hypothetical protein